MEIGTGRGRENRSCREHRSGDLRAAYSACVSDREQFVRVDRVRQRVRDPPGWGLDGMSGVAGCRSRRDLSSDGEMGFHMLLCS